MTVHITNRSQNVTLVVDDVTDLSQPFHGEDENGDIFYVPNPAFCEITPLNVQPE